MIQALYDLPAPAKLNLFLHVVGRRDDGYHLLQSVFRLIDWCDTLHLEVRHDGKLSRTDIGPPLPAEDLCLRAARLLQKASGTALGVHIGIDKKIPSGAGLGGGSSDAATTLIGLNRLWALHWPRSRLAELALQLGADVPFFIGGRNAWVEGIGEKLSPITLPQTAYAVLKPPTPIPTAAIFSSPLLSHDTELAILADFLADTNLFGKNDLQHGAIEYSSEVGQALNLLEDHVGPGRMSGSGSAVFAYAGRLPGASEESEGWRRLLATLPLTWTGRWCCSLDEHPLVGWSKD